MRKPLFTLICLLSLSVAWTQDRMPVKFGNVTQADFNVAPAGADSGAGAIVIADWGSSTIDENGMGGFTLEFKRSRRIKIVARRGFDAATVAIILFSAGNETEKVMGLRATTYNLENGKVVETRLDDRSVFTNRLSKNVVQMKFSLPAVKEGSIVEYRFTKETPFFFNLQPWEFQGEFPCLWSEYDADIPNVLQYVTLSHGYLPFSIHTTESKTRPFLLRVPGARKVEIYPIQVVSHRWVMKNVPPLKEESFTTTVRNYTAQLEFQLQRYNFPNGASQNILGNWNTVSESLLKAADFGQDLDGNSRWLDEDLPSITRGAVSQLEKAQRMYAFIRDKFVCTSHSGLYLGDPIKTVFTNRHGSEAELNLLLAGMLRHEKIAADPVILSTRSHGFANPIYPQLNLFNYVIVQATIDSARYFLDASEPWLAFGRLPERCYNGYARIISAEHPLAVYLGADSIREMKVKMAFVSKDEKGGLTAHLQSTLGFNEACIVREKYRSAGQEGFLKDLQSDYAATYAVSGVEIDSLERPDAPLNLSYDLQITPELKADVFYFNPMLGQGYAENPFKSAERKYPVEMPNALDEVYVLSMDIPDGYVVDEAPKSAKVLLNEDQGFFEYVIDKGEGTIQLRSHIRLNQANFKPEDYSTLRDFFGVIVKKQSEQIVIKKKK